VVKWSGREALCAITSRISATSSTGRKQRHPGPTFGRAYTERLIVLGLIIGIIVIGLIAGALARLLVPGRQDISILATIVIGIIGSFLGGFLGYVLFHKDSQDGFLQPAGIIGSVIGAIIVLLLWTRFSDRTAIRS
jgi:uncharacterized membrane protein YeaQ/YmgE (transglycosylase-associated protein family)